MEAVAPICYTQSDQNNLWSAETELRVASLTALGEKRHSVVWYGSRYSCIACQALKCSHFKLHTTRKTVLYGRV